MKSINSELTHNNAGKYLLGCGIAGILILLLTFSSQPVASQAILGGNIIHLPYVAGPDYPLPQPITTIPLAGALCSNNVGVNPTTGFTYVTNHDSGTVTILKDGAFIQTTPTAHWATHVSHQTNSPRSFVANLHGGVSLFENNNLISNILPANNSYGEPFATAYNPTNGYLYIAHILGGIVQVVDGTNTVANIPLNAGWTLDVTVDPDSGLVYVPSWENGNVYVIDNTIVVASFPLGWGPYKIALDRESGTFYTAHSSPNSQYPHNISVFERGSTDVTPISTGIRAYSSAVDPISGLAYIPNFHENSVSVLRGRQLLKILPVGEKPYDVSVNPNSGYAFVTNSGDDTVTILRFGEVVGSYSTGHKPVAVDVDPLTNYTYVINENSDVVCNEVNQCPTVCHDSSSVTVFR